MPRDQSRLLSLSLAGVTSWHLQQGLKQVGWGCCNRPPGLGLLQQAPRAGAAARDPLAAAARGSALRAEAESGALGRQASTTTTAQKTRADASALAEPEGPALVAAPSQQQEQSGKAEPAKNELSGGDSLDSLLGDLPPFPTDDPLSFWQASGAAYGRKPTT